jgi:hypothetical protein
MLAVLTMWPSLCAASTGREGPYPVDDSPQVDSQYPLPRGERAEPRVGKAAHARVIADHVHCFEAIDRGSCQGMDRRFVADIGGRRQRLGAQARDLLRGSLQSRLLDVGQDHVEPVASEPLGQRQADAAGGPVTTATFPAVSSMAPPRVRPGFKLRRLTRPSAPWSSHPARYPLRICSLRMSACPQCWASSRSTWRYTQRSGSGPRQ